MKKFIIVCLVFVTMFCFVGCGNGFKNPEKVAASNVENWFEYNFKEMLETYPSFRLRKRATRFLGKTEGDASIEKVAEAMHAHYTSEGRNVEILSTLVTEQNELTDYSFFDELKETYEDITLEEFKKITETATVKVEYSLDNNSKTVVLDQDIECIKMDGEWYVLSDGAFTN